MSGVEFARRRAVHWSAAEALARNILQFGLTVLLARWLTPPEFGAYALLMVLVAVAGMVVDGGLGYALIQSRDHSREDESSAFWFTMTAAVAAAMLFWFAGDWIAMLLGQPQLGPLTWVAGVIVVLSALQCVPTALASKQLDFRSQTHASLTAVAVSGACALWLGWRGAGVWALLAQAVTMAAVQTAMLWVKVPWRPMLVIRCASLRRLFRFGGFLLLANVVDTVASRLHLVLIGRYYDAGDLGQFTRAAGTKDIPQTALAGMFARVAFPVFTSEASHPADLRLSLRQSLVAMMAVNLPAMAGLCLMANLVVPVVFGPNWQPSVPLLQILCIAGVFWPMQIANVQALLAQGRSRLLLRMELFKKSVLVLVTLVASRTSIEAVAWGLAFSSLVSHMVNAHYSGKYLGYGNGAQFKDMLPYAGLAATMSVGVFLLEQWLTVPAGVARLLVLAVAGAAIYAVVLRLSGLDAWRLLWSLLPAWRSTPRLRA